MPSMFDEFGQIYGGFAAWPADIESKVSVSTVMVGVRSPHHEG